MPRFKKGMRVRVPYGSGERVGIVQKYDEGTNTYGIRWIRFKTDDKHYSNRLDGECDAYCSGNVMTLICSIASEGGEGSNSKAQQVDMPEAKLLFS